MSAVVPPDDRLPADGESAAEFDEPVPRVVTSRYVLTLGEWGAELEPAPKSDDSTWRPDAVPAIAPPPAPEFFLDREDLIREAIAALPSERPVVLCGAPGSGKTTLLHHFAHHPELADTFAGGILYLDAEQLCVEDTTQAVYDSLTSATNDIKAEGDRLRSLLQELSVLVLLDNTTGDRARVEQFAKVFPYVICTGGEPYPWEEGCVLEVTGFSGAEAIAILERELGRSLESEERAIAPNLSALLDGNPLALQQVAAFVRDRASSLADFFRESLSDASERPLLRVVLDSLTYDDRQVLAALAAIAPGTTSVSVLPHWLGDDIEPNVWNALVAKHLVSVRGDRAQLAANIATLIPQEWEVERCRDLWLTQWVERLLTVTSLQGNTANLDGATEDHLEITRAIAYGVEQKRWWDVNVLAKLIVTPIAASKRWGVWRDVLEAQREAARGLEDPNVEALALHQLGARSLALGDRGAAYDFLVEAERLRAQSSEAEAIAVTRHALALTLAERPIKGAGGWKATAAIFLATAAFGGAYWGWFTYLMPRPAIATLRRTHLDFERAQIERDIRRSGFVVESTGLSPVDIQDVTLGGDRPEDFAIVENTCETKTPLNPDDTCLVGVEFKPTTE
ncbi:MAG: hypothetical protein AAFX40_05540, partial [Cyanobacteria bacterium J06639_1]